MAEEKQIYISFEKRPYKENKSELLKTHIDLINLQKKINHLKAIRSNKKRYLSALNREFNVLQELLVKVDTKMPEPGYPKKGLIKNKDKQKVNKSKEDKRNIPEIEKDSLEEELKEIQRKLKQLE